MWGFWEAQLFFFGDEASFSNRKNSDVIKRRGGEALAEEWRMCVCVSHLFAWALWLGLTSMPRCAPALCPGLSWQEARRARFLLPLLKLSGRSCDGSALLPRCFWRSGSHAAFRKATGVVLAALTGDPPEGGPHVWCGL